MEYTKLGNTGMDVSRICLGCMGFGDAERWAHKWVLDEENSRPVIRKALSMKCSGMAIRIPGRGSWCNSPQ
jgi:aryl-alcohol dehydrogenase-like predicted oxidoreductase